eukprot:UN3533
MNRNRMENDRDPGIWNRNGRDDQQKRLVKELKVEINRSIKLYFLSRVLLVDQVFLFLIVCLLRSAD